MKKKVNRDEEERVNNDARVKQLQTKLLLNEQKIETLEQVSLSSSFFDQFFSFQRNSLLIRIIQHHYLTKKNI